MMPDPAFYRQCLQDSFEELLAAAGTANRPRRKAARNKATSKQAARKKPTRKKAA
jgi:hypothetical protein